MECRQSRGPYNDVRFDFRSDNWILVYSVFGRQIGFSIREDFCVKLAFLFSKLLWLRGCIGNVFHGTIPRSPSFKSFGHCPFFQNIWRRGDRMRLVFVREGKRRCGRRNKTLVSLCYIKHLTRGRGEVVCGRRVRSTRLGGDSTCASSYWGGHGGEEIVPSPRHLEGCWMELAVMCRTMQVSIHRENIMRPRQVTLHRAYMAMR